MGDDESSGSSSDDEITRSVHDSMDRQSMFTGYNPCGSGSGSLSNSEGCGKALACGIGVIGAIGAGIWAGNVIYNNLEY
jgi:hypothetical protein